MAILKESFSSKGSEPGFPGSEKLWNRNFPEPGMKKYREIGRSTQVLMNFARKSCFLTIIMQSGDNRILLTKFSKIHIFNARPFSRK